MDYMNYYEKTGFPALVKIMYCLLDWKKDLNSSSSSSV
jgi:hypothetical protein